MRSSEGNLLSGRTAWPHRHTSGAGQCRLAGVPEVPGVAA